MITAKIDTFLYYSRTVDLIFLTAINNIVAQKTKTQRPQKYALQN